MTSMVNSYQDTYINVSLSLRWVLILAKNFCIFTYSPAITFLLHNLFAFSRSISGNKLDAFPGHGAVPVVLHVALDTGHAHKLLSTRRIVSATSTASTEQVIETSHAGYGKYQDLQEKYHYLSERKFKLSPKSSYLSLFSVKMNRTGTISQLILHCPGPAVAALFLRSDTEPQAPRIFKYQPSGCGGGSIWTNAVSFQTGTVFCWLFSNFVYYGFSAEYVTFSLNKIDQFRRFNQLTIAIAHSWKCLSRVLLCFRLWFWLNFGCDIMSIFRSVFHFQ